MLHKTISKVQAGLVTTQCFILFEVSKKNTKSVPQIMAVISFAEYFASALTRQVTFFILGKEGRQLDRQNNKTSRVQYIHVRPHTVSLYSTVYKMFSKCSAISTRSPSKVETIALSGVSSHGFVTAQDF